jgi:hypothetical protein
VSAIRSGSQPGRQEQRMLPASWREVLQQLSAPPPCTERWCMETKGNPASLPGLRQLRLRPSKYSTATDVASQACPAQRQRIRLDVDEADESPSRRRQPAEAVAAPDSTNRRPRADGQSVLIFTQNEWHAFKGGVLNDGFLSPHKGLPRVRGLSAVCRPGRRRPRHRPKRGHHRLRPTTVAGASAGHRGSPCRTPGLIGTDRRQVGTHCQGGTCSRVPPSYEASATNSNRGRTRTKRGTA